MKCIVFVAVAALVAMLVAAALTGSQKMSRNEEAEQELNRIEREFGEAITRGDTGKLARLMADDFLAINNPGRELGKA